MHQGHCTHGSTTSLYFPGRPSAAWEVLEAWERPFLTLFSDQDPITAGLDEPFRSRIPGARGQPHQTIRNAGHFLQEDRPAELTAALLEFLRSASEP